MRGCNRVNITDPNDPLNRIIIWLRPGIIKVEACAETYIAGITANWFRAIANITCKKRQVDAGYIAI